MEVGVQGYRSGFHYDIHIATHFLSKTVEVGVQGYRSGFHYDIHIATHFLSKTVEVGVQGYRSGFHYDIHIATHFLSKTVEVETFIMRLWKQAWQDMRNNSLHVLPLVAAALSDSMYM